MKRQDDPNPLEDTNYKCGGCKDGIVRLDPDGETYRCNKCDFEMCYEDFKDVDLWVRHFLDQYPDLPPDDVKAFFEDDEHEGV